jgi:hypothetical protein
MSDERRAQGYYLEGFDGNLRTFSVSAYKRPVPSSSSDPLLLSFISSPLTLFINTLLL